MSIALVKAALQNFLEGSKPEVLCVLGRWGTGKTYAWGEALKEATATGKIGLKDYAYVSLFGVNDSSDLVQSIYANTTDLTAADKTTFPHSIGGFKTADMKKKAKSLGSFIAEHANIPHVAGLGGVARAVLANFVSDTLVCIDDFERKGKTISIIEIMGTVAQLRDVRRCKVVLILNDNSLDESERREFFRYSEKVIDRRITYIPTAAEAAAIAFAGSDQQSGDLRSACEILGIVNIRVMRRIGDFVRELTELLGDIDHDVRRSVMRSLVVIVWSIVSPEGEGAPPLDFLREKRQKQYFGANKVETTSQEDRWGVTLTEYGFYHVDEFDEAMVAGVENGFFDAHIIKACAERYLKDAERSRAQQALEAAWKPFHDSFSADGVAVANGIHDGCLANLKYLTPGNLDAAVRTLKSIGEPAKAQDLLTKFISNRAGSGVFDRKNDPFGNTLQDPDVIASFDANASKQIILPTPQEAATRIYKGGWSSGDEQSLAELSIDGYVALLHEKRGADLSVFVLGCLAFTKMGGTSERQREISRRIKEALLTVGRENPLNAHRVRKFEGSLPLDEA